MDISVRSGLGHLQLAILCGIMLPLMNNDFEHYNLAIRNDERLLKKKTINVTQSLNLPP